MQAAGSAMRSWTSTGFTQLMGIDYPIIQAPFGGLPSQRLTATVSNLGGLGSLGAFGLGRSAIIEGASEIRSLTAKPFAINLWVSTSDRETSQTSADSIQRKIRELAPYYAELGIGPSSGIEFKAQDFEVQVRAAIEARPAALSFIYGIPPKDILVECRSQGLKTMGTATTPEEAVVLEEAGVDLIVASGFEGAGHRGSFLRAAGASLMGGVSLVPQIVDAVDVPVIAAGGIADGRGLIAALALGAQGVQIGTAFLLCEGSGAGKAHRAALLCQAAKRTDLTNAFTGRLARGISNRLMNDLKRMHTPVLPFPLQHALIQTVAAPAACQEAAELMTVWAGQSAGLCRNSNVKVFFEQLIAQGDATLRLLSPGASKHTGGKPWPVSEVKHGQRI
ncbi:MAG TPA: nitronate monooxygenase [Xanthobacteraceae bacterium]